MELKRLGKYEIVGRIGQGGMGEVYQATDPILNRHVAIKTMMTGAGMDEDLRKRFLREAQSSALLNHPNIVTVFDFGEEQGRMYIVMELLLGTDLKQVIKGPRLPLDAQLDIMEHICDGLAFAHSKGIVHRDLKPANIHVAAGRHVKIMDFGLARLSSSDLTRAGVIMGTPHYMSPEQVRGEMATTRSDVFSLGAVFHELLSGTRAFEGESMPSVMYNVMQAEPAPLETLRPEIPKGLAGVIRHALQKDPAARPADAGELGRAIRAAGITLRTPTPEGAYRATSGLGATERRTSASLSRPVDEATLAEPRRLEDAGARRGSPALRRETEASDARGVPGTGARRARSPLRVVITAAVAAGLFVVALGGAGLVWHLTRGVRSPAWSPAPHLATPTPAASAVAAPSAAPDLELVRQALQDRDYRRAIALVKDAKGAPERELLERAERSLRESDATARRVRGALLSRDGAAASKALGQLVELDPRHPDLRSLTDGLEVLLQEKRPPTTGPSVAQKSLATPAPLPTPATPRPTPMATPVATPEAVVSKPSPAVAPPPLITPEEGIRRALDRYRDACARVDSVAIRRVFPLIRDSNLKAIARMRRYDVRFEDVQIRLEGESKASVSCMAFYEAMPKEEKRAASRFEKRETIRLERVDGSWVIRSIE